MLLALPGSALFRALLLTAGLVCPIPPFPRPTRGGRAALLAPRAALAVVALAGALTVLARGRTLGEDCRTVLEEGARLRVEGVLEGGGAGRTVLHVEPSGPGVCAAPLRIRQRERPDLLPGDRVVVRGRWRRGIGPATTGLAAGLLVADSVAPAPGADLGWTGAELRARALRSVRDIFPNHAGLVSALVLASRDGLDPEVREDFARAGTAHLLAISGFHVGVVAAMILALLRLARVPARRAALLGAVVVWAYVFLLGTPDAASRAAVLLTLVAVARAGGRPVHALGALSTAWVLLLVADPLALLRPGFQLSFAGAVGLALWARPLEAWLTRGLPRGRFRWLTGAVAAGVAATVATLPVVAWHFERVSLVGIPATLVGGPLVAVVLPGIFMAGLAHAASPAAGTFLGGGVELFLDALVASVDLAAAVPFADVAVHRSALVTVALGAGAGLLLLRAPRPLRGRTRVGVLLAGGLAAVLVQPAVLAVESRGTVEIRMLDVGQGDAILIRSPQRRWVLVDAGPGPPPGSAATPDPSRSRVVRELGRAGASRLEALVLSHPDLDHIGGAREVMAAAVVGAIMDPALTRGTSAYVGALEFARAEPASWTGLRAGDRLVLDGMTLDVLHPVGVPDPDTDPNDASVVLLLRYGLFTALLTGDAPASAEELSARGVGPVDVLKVGHHGSATSTSAAFLEEIRPSLALISVGRDNRYGHPDPGVMDRLYAATDTVARTDRDGTVRVVARRDGTWELHRERESSGPGG
ncbi:MAG TPA: DNA internalization-related competence protein ComEC/Rec2 [Longimicrobiales bacterium]